MSLKENILKIHLEDAAKKTAKALSDMSGEIVKVENSIVDVVEINKINSLYGSVNGKIAIIKFSIQAKLKGEILLLPSTKEAETLAIDMASKKIKGEIDRNIMNSVIGEIGNVMSATYVSSIGKYFNDILMPSVPRLSFLESFDLIQKYIIDNSEIQSRALMIACDFVVGENRIRIPFLFLLKPESIDTFIGNM